MLMTGGGGGGGVLGSYDEVCFAHFILGGSGGIIYPRKFLNFRPSEITSGAFLSIVLLCCVAFAINYPCVKKVAT